MKTASAKQVFVFAFVHHPTTIHDYDLVRAADGGQNGAQMTKVVRPCDRPGSALACTTFSGLSCVQRAWSLRPAARSACCAARPRDVTDARRFCPPTAQSAAARPAGFQTAAPALGRKSEMGGRPQAPVAGSFSVTFSRAQNEVFAQGFIKQTVPLCGHDREQAAQVGNVHVQQEATPAIVTPPLAGSIKRVNRLKMVDLPPPNCPGQGASSRPAQHAMSDRPEPWLRR